jgi:flagellar basal-body rod protein FlgF
MSSIESLAQSMQFQWLRHEILSNNLANASTPAFKRDDLAMIPDNVPTVTSTSSLLPLPTGGSFLQWTDFSQGAVQGTGRTLDAAINGSGFFVIETPAGPRYTRAGGLDVRPDGVVVGPTGAPILGRTGVPMTVTSSNITIGAAGEVLDNGRLVDTLRVVDFPKPYRLAKEGHGIYAPLDPTVEPVDAQGYEITGGALEASNVGTLRVMVTMIDVLRTYEASQRAMQAVEETNKHATSEIGKVS